MLACDHHDPEFEFVGLIAIESGSLGDQCSAQHAPVQSYGDG
jgi:hypothetical protein